MGDRGRQIAILRPAWPIESVQVQPGEFSKGRVELRCTTLISTLSIRPWSRQTWDRAFPKDRRAELNQGPPNPLGIGARETLLLLATPSMCPPHWRQRPAHPTSALHTRESMSNVTGEFVRRAKLSCPDLPAIAWAALGNGVSAKLIAVAPAWPVRCCNHFLSAEQEMKERMALPACAL